jgi:two-component system, cell cycle sensor histidine kinase and response regulator CckA
MKTTSILVVEDEVIIAMEIKDRLTRLGYQVPAMAASGEEAIRKAGEHALDLVLMDIMLEGDMDGVEAAERIRGLHGLPVIFLTAYSDNHTLERAKISEPFGYILKPFDERELHTAIEIALYRHQMEKRLKESEQWFSTTLKSIGDAVITTDIGHRITFMNPVAETLTGWSQAEAAEHPLEEVFRIAREDDRAPVENPIGRAVAESGMKSVSEHSILTSRTGAEIPIDNSAAPIRNEKGTITGAVLVFRDITEHRKLEKQLRQAQKMEAVGTLAGGVAHDFNNLLTAIRGSVDIAMLGIKPSDPIHQDLKEIQISAERASDLIRQLLMFSRNQPLEFSFLSLNRIVENLLKLLHRLIGEDIGISTSMDPELWSIRADRVTIEQVILNLAINARDAMPNGGKVSIRTENVTVQEAYCQSVPEAKPGQYVRMSVTDTGTGMDPGVVQRIFEPFFSTKGPGKGTGLGLSVVYGIVQQHGGWINVYSEPGQGTTFKIYFPAFHEKPAAAQTPKHSDNQLRGHHERILVVEDEKNVREFVSKALAQCGYTLFIAADSREAMDLFGREQGCFDLVFSDVVLPDQNGIELVEEMRRQKPDLHVLLSSGYTDHKSQWPRIQEKGYRFLQKPYTLTELLTVLKEEIRKP